jgi:hypothetical protein
VSDRENRKPRKPIGGVEQALDIERLAFSPNRERRRGQEVVELHGEVSPIFGREEQFQIHNAYLFEWRLLDPADETRDVHVTSFAPRSVEEFRKKDVLAAADRIRLGPRQAEETQQS